MKTFFTLKDFASEFLSPLTAQHAMHVDHIALNEMNHWSTASDGTMTGPVFNLEAHRVSFTPNVPASWDQPIYHQPPGTLFLIIDEENNILLKATFEPGNAGRGFNHTGLILNTSCKYSPGNMAMRIAEGKTIPFSDLPKDPRIKTIIACDAPGDGGRADKLNHHAQYRVPKEVIKEYYERLPEQDQAFFAMVSMDLFKEIYRDCALAGEHLRDLASLFLFL